MVTIWAQVDILVHLSVFQAVVLYHSSYYRICLRVYKQLEDRRIAALPVNAGPTLFNAGGDRTTEIPEVLLPLINVPPDVDTYMSRPFFSKDENDKVTINEVAHFRAELPALPSILNSSAIFVEAQLLVYPVTENGAIVKNKEEKDCSEPAAEVVDTKVFRLANLTFGGYEYYPCNLEGEHIQSVAHLFLQTAVVKFYLSHSINQPLSKPPCESYEYWGNTLRTSKNKLVQDWFFKSNYEEDLFYKPATTPAQTQSCAVNVLCKKCDDSHPIFPRGSRNSLVMVERFVSQVLRGDDDCNSIFGIDEYHAQTGGTSNSLPEETIKSILTDEYTYMLAPKMMLYVYAKILLQNAINIGRVRKEELSRNETSVGIGDSISSETPKSSLKASLRQRTSEHAEAESPSLNSTLFNDNTLLTFNEGNFEVVNTKQGAKHEPLFVPLSDYAPHLVLCEHLNAMGRRLGIQRWSSNQISISVSNGIKIIFNDTVIQKAKNESYDVSLSRALHKFLVDISTWIHIKWEDHIAHLFENRLEDHHVTTYFNKQGAVYKKFGDPGMNEAKIVRLLKSLYVTDEHYFFLSDCYPFYQYLPGPPLRAADDEQRVGPDKVHLVVMLHGWNGYPVTMRYYKNNIKAYVKYTDVLVLRSMFDELHGLIDYKAKLVVDEICTYIRRNIGEHRLGKISFVAHSLGGLVIRAALKYLSQYEGKLHALIAMSTPQVGLPYMTPCARPICKAVVNTFYVSPCLKQLFVLDEENTRQCYLYSLSQDDCIKGLKSVKLVGILQDWLAPAYSCLLDLSLTKGKNVAIDEMKTHIDYCLRGSQVEKFYVDYKRAGKHLQWVFKEAHEHLIDRPYLVRIFLAMTFDIFNTA